MNRLDMITALDEAGEALRQANEALGVIRDEVEYSNEEERRLTPRRDLLAAIEGYLGAVSQPPPSDAAAVMAWAVLEDAIADAKTT